MSKKREVSSAELDLLLNGGETVDVTEEVQAAEAAKAEAAAVKSEADLLAEHLAKQSAALAKLGEFQLRPLAKELFLAACDNVATNVGSNSMAPEVQKQIQLRAGLMAACGNDLSKVVDLIVEANGNDPREASATIYSTCFAVQKAMNFIVNLRYRRALDPKEDEDLVGTGAVKREDGATFAADPREEQRDPVPGLQPDEYERSADYDPVTPLEDQLVEAYVEVHDYLQLLTEAFGWDPERPMPFLYVMEGDDKFVPITDPIAALDIQQVRAKEARAKRTARQNDALASALAAARKQLKAAAARS